MTEAEWLAATDPGPMLDAAGGRMSGRKLRLFAVACCRRTWPLLTDPRTRAAVEFLDRHADAGPARRRGFPAARRGAGDAYRALAAERDRPGPVPLDGQALAEARALAAYGVAGVSDPAQVGWVAVYLAGAAGCAAPGRKEDATRAERAAQAGLLRCLLGDPSRPAACDPSWRTEAVVGLARGMYESRDFAPMPVLADAIEDAGCTDPDVLAHCRGPSPHVRGCWVVDLVLGKG